MDEQGRYKIPANFTNLGYFFNGRLAKRNAVDAVILIVIGILLCRLLPIPADASLSVTVFVAGLLGALGCAGIHGLPVSYYLVAFTKWLSRRQPKFYNPNSGLYSVSAADIVLTEKQLGDYIATTVNKLRSHIGRLKPEYIEGENFEFLDDPELLALLDMDERLRQQEKLAETEGEGSK